MQGASLERLGARRGLIQLSSIISSSLLLLPWAPVINSKLSAKTVSGKKKLVRGLLFRALVGLPSLR